MIITYFSIKNICNKLEKLKNKTKLIKSVISNKSSKPLKSNVENIKCQCKRILKTFLHFKYILLNVIFNNITLINNYNYIFQKSSRKNATNVSKLENN